MTLDKKLTEFEIEMKIKSGKQELEYRKDGNKFATFLALGSFAMGYIGEDCNSDFFEILGKSWGIIWTVGVGSLYMSRTDTSIGLKKWENMQKRIVDVNL